ncbi:hypothetical protein WDJ51_02960 [Rathayibacter sp. YIM 133350]|uniref:hypothetical protein n=1 Tax=Rathayibacter sp. YIM 133350 TaxID=3131992 RepID=UPI00307D72AA
MRVLANVVSTIVATALLLGAIFLLIRTTPHVAPGFILLSTTALTVFIYAPVFLGAVLAYWDMSVSPDARRFFRRLLGWTIAVEALGVLAIILWAVLVGAPAWLPAVFIVVAAILLGIAIVVGRALMRHEQSHPRPQRPATAWTRKEIWVRVAIIAAAFVVTAVIVIVIFISVGLLEDADKVWTPVSFALQAGFFVSALTGIVLAAPMNRRLREALGSDVTRARVIVKVVLRRKRLLLDTQERRAAVRYATLVPTLLVFSVIFLTLLYCGIGLQQASMLARGPGSLISAILLPLLAIVYVWFIVQTILRTRNARAYLRDHVADLDQPLADEGDAGTEERGLIDASEE